MRIGRAICKRAIVAWTAGFLPILPVHATEIDGAWANDLDNCPKIFEKENNQAVFTNNSDLYGNGFIINGTVKGKLATCRVKSRKMKALW